MLHRGGGRTTEPQYCRIRHPVRQKRKGARQDTSSVPSAGSQYIPPGLQPSSRTSHFTPLRFADRTTRIRRPGPILHFTAGGERTPPPHPEYSRGGAESAPPHRCVSCDDSGRQMAHAELERRRNEGKNDRSDLSRTEINRPKILQTLKNVLSLRRKTNGKRRKMDNHVPFLLFPKGCKSQHFDSQHVVCMA